MAGSHCFSSNKRFHTLASDRELALLFTGCRLQELSQLLRAASHSYPVQPTSSEGSNPGDEDLAISAQIRTTLESILAPETPGGWPRLSLSLDCSSTSPSAHACFLLVSISKILLCKHPVCQTPLQGLLSREPSLQRNHASSLIRASYITLTELPSEFGQRFCSIYKAFYESKLPEMK